MTQATVVAKLTAVLDSATTHLDLRIAATKGLGRAGGALAELKLSQIVDSTTSPLALRSAAAEALGEACRTE